jgi:hypothetical protein
MPRPPEFTCRNVWERGRPVLYVFHDDNGDWQLLCGGNEHADDREIVVLHKDHLLARDPSLAPTFEPAEGWVAARESADAPWRNTEYTENGE